MTIIIKAKHNGFRRCGIAHPSQPTKYADDFFTEEQLKALIKEPQLILAYEEDEFDQVQDEPNADISKAALSQAPDAAPATQSQASETVITPVAASLAVAAEPVHVAGAPETGGTEPVLGGASDHAVDPLTGPAPLTAPVVQPAEPIQADATEPVGKVLSVEVKPEKARSPKAKDSAK
ncbi:HI1506-related protein [Pseudomonas costantinii]|uniref:Mu-like prophage FluMu N-terminal domain-containing protein n=1 Tax=Pseudomonas costantinii TaxID=168469 RepID=A0A1S2UB34_9PSED|nr:HI1506-related protein [Pseudomonas costantinii]OIN43340.1 hypothetical protein BFL40_32330 [Pseudomonas costantinii]SEE38085.1 hypothetical protein SAMN04515675_5227 [Pseudomonas costantinii]